MYNSLQKLALKRKKPYQITIATTIYWLKHDKIWFLYWLKYDKIYK